MWAVAPLCFHYNTILTEMQEKTKGGRPSSFVAQKCRKERKQYKLPLDF
ncbi:hypothetical protein BRYFOR_07642 [Marvinbryantia formatexigens DSM 14469]|uniref:Uncharacterized protein n=1 Tax=Marvinbryantia formatexigens DSM 14469 TaxID=478749 RepID=C6LG82_9FIRM|nr:hypothetical protein BRYFOR_07642 [Marvinbryantia formatexigens DSM 14469]